METRKTADGNLRVTLSGSDLIDALEEKFGGIYENITESASVLEIHGNYSHIEITIGED